MNRERTTEIPVMASGSADHGEGPRIASVGRALGRHRYTQDELIEALRELWAEQHHNPRRLERFHRAVQVDGRRLALPLERYGELEGFGEANDAFIREGTELGAEAIERALGAAGLSAGDVDAIFFTTVTGLATPTIDARLVDRLGLRRDVRRTPMFGLGCVGGAAGVARMADYLRAYPEHTAVLLSVELCSLTLQRDDLSIPNLIATGLFGDGAVAVVARGADASGADAARSAADREQATRGGGAEDASAAAVGGGAVSAPSIVANRSVFYRETEHIMGWTIGSGGFEIVLSADLPGLIVESLRPDVDDFLAGHGLERADIEHWICHPGGPKVLEAMGEALELDDGDLELTWESLRAVGNLSSASVLLVLEDTLRKRAPRPGQHGVLMAMGPGFCAELVLLSW